ASPYKFPRAVSESLGLDTTGTDFTCMDTLAKATGTTGPKALRDLEWASERFDTVIDIDHMGELVSRAAAHL
ncbi:MAG: threonine synthase, partial [Bifidobacterium mongoliense]|nr:threonine synthase [Bifidobacterium mongoliense]